MKCAIIKDLLPLYCDGLVSDETREEVDSHLAECPDCRGVYESMKTAAPDAPKPDIQPMKKIKRKLRLRMALLIVVVAVGITAGLYNLLCAHPMLTSSKNVSYNAHSSGAGQTVYNYTDNRGYSAIYKFFPGEEPVIDVKNDCLLLDGEKVLDDDGNIIPANGELADGGFLRINIECDTVFKCIKYKSVPAPDVWWMKPIRSEVELRPCLPFRQNINECLTDNTFHTEFPAYQCGEGAVLTIKCRDKDIVIDLHQLAVEEGLIKENS